MGSIKTNSGTMSKGFINIDGTTKSISKIFYGSTQIFSNVQKLSNPILSTDWDGSQWTCECTNPSNNPQVIATIYYYYDTSTDSYDSSFTQTLQPGETKVIWRTQDETFVYLEVIFTATGYADSNKVTEEWQA